MYSWGNKGLQQFSGILLGLTQAEKDTTFTARAYL